MATGDKILVSSSQYDIYSKLLAITKKYTNISDEDFLRTGLFGYITESMAMIARDSSLHKTMLYNESFLNTAVMPKSVYNWAKMFNINITSATPAYADILVTIAIEDIGDYSINYYGSNEARYGAEVTSINKPILILDRANPFIAGQLNFMTERSVLIYRSSENSGTFIVKYCATEEPTTNFETLDSYFLKSSISRTDGIEYLSFRVRAYQYTRAELVKQISSSSFLDTKIHKFEFEDQFVGARLYYKRGTDAREEVQLRFSNIEYEDVLSATAKYAYYNLSSSNILQVTFSSGTNNFIPAANSTLYLDIFTTKGSQGNIQYTGELIFRLKDEALRNLPVLASFFDTYSAGGIDTPSISKIKNKIINEISTRDVIVTENDLNSYFLILTALLETINDGSIKFIKRRDDILRRVFGSYILMRDGLDSEGNTAASGYLSKVIPTNTIDADFTLSDNISKPFGTMIKKKTSNSAAYEECIDVPSDDDYYIIPFYTRVILQPFKKVKYIYNLADDSTNLTYKSITSNNSDKYLIPSTVSVYRGLDGIKTSNYYTFKFTFVTNFDLKNDLVRTANDSFDISFYRKGNETVPINSINFKLSDKDELVVRSVANEDNPAIFESELEFNIPVKSDTVGAEFNFANKEEYGTNIVLIGNNQEIYLPEDVKVVLKLNNITTDSITMDFISGGYLSLFRNLDELMHSDITIRTTGTPAYISSIQIKDIPVVHGSFFTDETAQTKFIKQLFVYIDMLKENLGKLETNTFFDLKFYNTYGDSQYYNTLRTNLKLELDVYVKQYYEGLRTQIKDYVRLLVDKANQNLSLRISDIIRDLTIAFNGIIDRVEFKGLNDTFAQYIGEISTIRKNLFAPEYLNISEENLQYIRVGYMEAGEFIKY